jgi:phage shock protein E
MKAIAIIIAVVAIIGIGAWVLVPDNSSSNNSTATPASQQQTNPAQTAVSAAKNGTAIIYDVRTPEEFSQKHVEAAINFNVEDMQAGTLPTVAKDSQIYVYCRSGNRSNQAKEILQANGFTNVTDLGGLTDLEQAGVL